MKSNSRMILAGATALVLFCQFANAHPGHASTGIAAGISHPFTGVDHLLAMIAIGLCAAQLGGRAIWMIPGAFLAAMLTGAALGIGQTSVPLTEQGIAASVFVMGLIVLIGWKTRAILLASLAAIFGVFHGYAHGHEMTVGLQPLTYALGFTTATTALMLTGILIGITLRRIGRADLARWAGGAIAGSGLLLLLS